MRTLEVKLPELAFVAGTRGMLGVGIGLLASNYLKADQRKAIGLGLIALGAATTIPIALRVFGEKRQLR